jgi:hypothetical protein
MIFSTKQSDKERTSLKRLKQQGLAITETTTLRQQTVTKQKPMQCQPAKTSTRITTKTKTNTNMQKQQ